MSEWPSPLKSPLPTTEGLSNQPRRNGPLPRLSTEQLAKMTEWVEQGPNFEQHGVGKLLHKLSRPCEEPHAP
jgi:hypothetical protein